MKKGFYIGVLLSGEFLHDNNVDICKSIIRELNTGIYNLICKFHPTSFIESYPKGIKKGFLHTYGSEISSTDFIELCDYLFIGPSTVIYETLYG